MSGVDESQRRAAKVAGSAYVLIIVLSVLKLMVVGPLFVAGDDAATMRNIMSNELLFRAGVAGDVIVFLLVVVLSQALYLVLKAVDAGLALLALLMRFGEAILGGVVTVIGGLIPLLLIHDNAGFDTEETQALVGLFLHVQTVGLSVVMIFMGVGGTVFCYLFFRSAYIPRILAAWGIFTYVTMLILSFVTIFVPELPEAVLIVAYTPGALFEVTIGVWLLFKGLRPAALVEVP